MGRSALITAVDNENMDMLTMLLESGVQVKVSRDLWTMKIRNIYFILPLKDALLEAIREQYVEGVEALLDWEEKIHKPGDLYVS
jgi:transient receptor potential cation channel subfamily C member 4